MTKYELGLQRINKLEEYKKKFDELNKVVEQIDNKMKKLGGGFKISKVQNLIKELIEEFSGVEFISKEVYCEYFNAIKEFRDIEDEIDKLYYKIGNDFGKFNLFEYNCLGIDLLGIGTYDSLICPDYPCTSEIMYNDKFSYYLTSDPMNEIVIDSPEKCWDYLKENYDAIND